ncbi:MAG: RNA pseudouridine synthase [Hyphomonadaceae bacterium]|nr:RNA pseudouridine synthase [Hyphomonadaceae bacterium]
MPRDRGGPRRPAAAVQSGGFQQLRERAKALTLHADPRLLVINKPAGLASQPGRGLDEDVVSLMQGQARDRDRPVRLVHRLDRETSGVMVMARTAREAARLSALFAGHGVMKAYLALVHGDATGLRDRIDVPLKPMRTARAALVQVAGPNDPDAHSASTGLQVLATSAGASLVLATPKTGRMHQIRVHLAHAGHPLLGDHHYGGPLAVSGIRVTRIMLHAWWLDLPDAMDQVTRWSAPVPEDFATLCDRLGLGLRHGTYR